MSEFWDERYSPEEYYYGKEPNEFLKFCIDSNPAGKILLPGDGEGRNSVYAATKGWEVSAFDLSSMGRKKALQLAREQGVNIHYEVADIDDLELGENRYDMIALIYFHLYPGQRIINHKRFIEALKPGGKLIMEVFSKKQLGKTSGGPKDLDLLYDVEDLKVDFGLLDISRAEELTVVKDKKNVNHEGEAEIIRFIGTKPN